MILNTPGYGYKDLNLVPAKISYIKSRSECNPFLEDGSLPIFTAPMDTVVNKENFEIWKQNNIIPILPRNIDSAKRENIVLTCIPDYIMKGEWVALSLEEFKTIFCSETTVTLDTDKKYTFRICIDIANGHMHEMYCFCNMAKILAKERGYELVIMVGNIANPETYKWICENAEVDFVRCSIGSGAGCTTASNTGIHYPIASLIDECYQIKKTVATNKPCPKIIADGGIRNYDDVVKALGLGADYVMIGSVFASLFESAAQLRIDATHSHYQYYFTPNGNVYDGVDKVLNIWEDRSDNGEQTRIKFIKEMRGLVKEFYGMSTKKAQKNINPNAKKLKTSEGCTKTVTVTHTINQWRNNMVDYLKSPMSYCNAKTLSEFIGKQKFIPAAPGEIAAVNK